MSTHTPGPWHQGGLDRHDKHWMRETRDAKGRGIAWCGTFPEDEAHANARLIAAAPEMLEALEEIVSAADGDGWSQLDADLRKARAAIAKAKGGEA